MVKRNGLPIILGFTQLGEKQSEVLELDQQKFKQNFVELSLAHNSINQEFVLNLYMKLSTKHTVLKKIHLKKIKLSFIIYIILVILNVLIFTITTLIISPYLSFVIQ